MEGELLFKQSALMTFIFHSSFTGFILTSCSLWRDIECRMYSLPSSFTFHISYLNIFKPNLYAAILLSLQTILNNMLIEYFKMRAKCSLYTALTQLVEKYECHFCDSWTNCQIAFICNRFRFIITHILFSIFSLTCFLALIKLFILALMMIKVLSLLAEIYINKHFINHTFAYCYAVWLVIFKYSLILQMILNTHDVLHDVLHPLLRCCILSVISCLVSSIFLFYFLFSISYFEHHYWRCTILSTNKLLVEYIRVYSVLSIPPRGAFSSHIQHSLIRLTSKSIVSFSLLPIKYYRWITTKTCW